MWAVCERLAAIQEMTRSLPCPSCWAAAGQPCTTRMGRLAEQSHTPRIDAAVDAVDGAASARTRETDAADTHAQEA